MTDALLTGPPEKEIDLLLKAHDRAIARRNRERRFAEQEKELRALARRLKRGEHVPGGLTAILGPAGVK
jgi:hypothetical protein